jgi:DNA helicase HerA-like ATPase
MAIYTLSKAFGNFIVVYSKEQTAINLLEPSTDLSNPLITNLDLGNSLKQITFDAEFRNQNFFLRYSKIGRSFDFQKINQTTLVHFSSKEYLLQVCGKYRISLKKDCSVLTLTKEPGNLQGRVSMEYVLTMPKLPQL